jgi:hypothetical protein
MDIRGMTAVQAKKSGTFPEKEPRGESAGGFIGANEDRAFAMTAPKRKWENDRNPSLSAPIASLPDRVKSRCGCGCVVIVLLDIAHPAVDKCGTRMRIIGCDSGFCCRNPDRSPDGRPLGQMAETANCIAMVAPRRCTFPATAGTLQDGHIRNFYLQRQQYDDLRAIRIVIVLIIDLRSTDEVVLYGLRLYGYDVYIRRAHRLRPCVTRICQTEYYERCEPFNHDFLQ